MDNFDTRTHFRCTSTNIFRKENCFGDKFNFLPYFAKKKMLKTVNWCVLLFHFIISVIKICLPYTGTLTNTWRWSLTSLLTFSCPALYTVRRRKMIGRQCVRMSGPMYSASSMVFHLPILWILHQSRFEEEGENGQSLRFWSHWTFQFIL